MKDYDIELDNILNEIDEDNKVIEASKENKILLEELKKQKEILNNQIKEYHQLIDDANTFYSKQNEIIEASDKYTKILLATINSVLDTGNLLEKRKNENCDFYNLFSKLEKGISMANEKMHNEFENKIKSYKTLKIWILCLFISQIIEFILIILSLL